MSLKQLALKAGLTFLEDSLQPGSVDDIKPQTAIAANVWALGHDGINEEPFPSVGQGDLVLSDAFTISGWGRVWFQRQFWLVHKQTGIKTRWINGRTAPMKK